MTPDQISRDWYRGNYLVSTKRALLQPDAINAAFASGLMWWTERLPEETLLKELNNSLCLGVYLLPDSTSTTAGESGSQMIGFIRVVTDYVTFGYLTDVYVLKEYQGKGLAKWALGCLGEILDEWNGLRHFFLFTHSSAAMRLYTSTLKAVDFKETPTSKLIFMERRGPGAKDETEEVLAELKAHAEDKGGDHAKTTALL